MDISNLSVTFVSGLVYDEYLSYASSNYNNTGNPKIILSRKGWDEYNDLEKEGLIFHELGHAILEREHNYDLLPDGSLKSMMGSSDAYSFNENKRDYYIAELFNEKEPIPDWAKEYTVVDTTIYFSDAIDSLNTVWETFEAKGFGEYVDSMTFSSPPYGLSISSEIKRHISPAWELRLERPTLHVNQSILLRTKITTHNLIGDGIEIRFPKKGNVTSIGYPRPDYKNVRNKTVYTTLKNYNDIEDFILRLEMLPETTGKVTFDDIELLVLTERKVYYKE